MAKNVILKGSFDNLMKFLSVIVQILDDLCSKLNGVYQKHPWLIMVQSVFLFVGAGYLLGLSKVMDSIWSSHDKVTLYKATAVVIALVGYLICVLVLFVRAYGKPKPEKPRTPPAVRAGVQWALQAIVTYLAELAKAQKTSVDWQLTMAVIMVYLHVVSTSKGLGKLPGIGAGDSLLAIANVFGEELLRDSPLLKLIFTIVFALVIIFREHRTKVKARQAKMRDSSQVVAGSPRDPLST